MVLNTKVKPVGVKLLLWGLAALIAVNLLQRFNVYDLTGFQPDLLTLISILFVSTEIGVMAALRRRKKLDAVGWFGTVVVILAFVSLIFGWLGLSLGMIGTFKGLIDLALLVFVLVEIFR